MARSNRIFKDDHMEELLIKKQLISMKGKYEDRLRRVSESIESFPEKKEVLDARKNVYADILMDLEDLINGTKAYTR